MLHHPVYRSLFITETFYCPIANSFGVMVSLHYKLIRQAVLVQLQTFEYPLTYKAPYQSTAYVH